MQWWVWDDACIDLFIFFIGRSDTIGRGGMLRFCVLGRGSQGHLLLVLPSSKGINNYCTVVQLGKHRSLDLPLVCCGV